MTSSTVASSTEMSPGRGRPGLPGPRAQLWLASGRASRWIGASRAIAIGGGGLVVMCLLCIIVPIVWPSAPNAMTAAPLQAPSLAHPFGTDDLGRDVMSRAFAAGRLDIAAALGVVAVGLVVGSAIGAAVAMSRSRWVDIAVMRCVDALLAFPYMVILLLLVTVIGPGSRWAFLPTGLPAILIAFLLVDWTFYSRLARGEAMSLRERDFVIAAELAGFSRTRVLAREILPIVFRQTATYAVLDAIVTMGALASFSFLGVGVQPPTAEWGNMMFEAQNYLTTAWWMLIGPAVLLAVTGLFLSILADGLLAERAHNG